MIEQIASLLIYSLLTPCLAMMISIPDEATAMDWLKPALSHIATQTLSMVVEDSHDTAASDVEYDSVIHSSRICQYG